MIGPSVPLVVDAGALRRLADRSPRSLILLRTLRERGLWPAQVAAPVLVEALTGDVATDDAVEALLRCCHILDSIAPAVAHRAAWLRTAANRGTATDALIVALAEPGGAVLVAQRPTIEAMALYADGVFVERA